MAPRCLATVGSGTWCVRGSTGRVVQPAGVRRISPGRARTQRNTPPYAVIKPATGKFDIQSITVGPSIAKP